MQGLQGDQRAFLMHGLAELAVWAELIDSLQARLLCRSGMAQRHVVDAEATGDDQGGAAARTFYVKSAESLETIIEFLESGMHRAHHDAVAQSQPAHLQRLAEQREALSRRRQQAHGLIDLLACSSGRRLPPIWRGGYSRKLTIWSTRMSCITPPIHDLRRASWLE